MDARCKIFGKNSVNEPMPCDPPLPCKLRRDDSHPKMALARWMRSGMAFMLMRLVDDLERVRPQFCH